MESEAGFGATKGAEIIAEYSGVGKTKLGQSGASVVAGGNSAATGSFRAMIAITITPAAHQAVKASLLGTADATPRPGADGLIRIWLDDKFVDRLAQDARPWRGLQRRHSAAGEGSVPLAGRACSVSAVRGSHPRLIGARLLPSTNQFVARADG